MIVRPESWDRTKCMPRRRSALEANLPAPRDFVALARRWRADAIEILLGYIWQGLDRLKAHGFIFDPDQENIERVITQLLTPEIRDAMTGAEPYYLEHGPYEDETRVGLKTRLVRDEVRSRTLVRLNWLRKRSWQNGRR